MPNTNRIPDNLGFLTVVDHPKHGLIGGYLVLNQAGRPLEFHCTSPVKPNRAQEILYGATLEPYLYGEQIAHALLSRAKTPTGFILTDHAAVLAVQEQIDRPIVYVFAELKKKKAPNDLIELSEAKSGEETFEITEELNESLKSFGIENAKLQTQTDSDQESKRVPEIAGLDTRLWQTVKIGYRTIALPGKDIRLTEELNEASRSVDLIEPFTRIRLAIEEAQRAA